MGNYKQLKQAVADVIKTNGNQEITGAILKNSLLNIISTVGANATFAGIATPDTNPGTPDQNVFYVAAIEGIYVNFNNIEVGKNEVVLLRTYNYAWIANKANIAQATEVVNKSNITYTDDDTINKFILKLFIDKTGYIGSLNVDVIKIRTIVRDISGQYVFSFETADGDVLIDLSNIISGDNSIYSVEKDGIYYYAEVNWQTLEKGHLYSFHKEINSNSYIQDPRSIISLYDKDLNKSQTEINNIANIAYTEFSEYSINNILEELSIAENAGFNYYKFNTGVLIAVSGTYKTKLVEIESGKDYYITTALTGQECAMAVFFDEDMQYIGYQNRCVESGQEYKYTNEKVIYPNGCKYIGVTRNGDCIDKIIIKTTSTKKYINTNALHEKKIASAGDSITEGVQTDDIPSYEDEYKPLYGRTKKTHMYFIAKENKCKWYNYGVSGSTLGDCFAIGTSGNGFSKKNGRYTQMAEDIDYLIIMFGTNDADYGMWMEAELYVRALNGGVYKMFPAKGHYIGDERVMTQDEYDHVIAYSGEIDGQTYTGMDYWRRKYIGNIDDTTNKTWCGAWNVILDYIFQKYKDIKILIWLNPTNYVFDESTKAIAEKWGVPYLDMHNIAYPTIWARNEQEQTYIGGVKLNSFQKGRNLTKMDIYTADGLHPNLAGYKYLYPIIDNKLKSI